MIPTLSIIAYQVQLLDAWTRVGDQKVGVVKVGCKPCKNKIYEKNTRIFLPVYTLGEGQFGNDSLPCCQCRLVATRDISADVPYSQADFLTWLPLVAALIVISFIITTKRKSGKTNCCRGYFGIPDAINMLDNERTRFINAALFFVMGGELTLMILDASLVDVPYYLFKSPDFPFILKKLLIIAYYLVVFAPIVMGLPRYDLFGSVMVSLSKYRSKHIYCYTCDTERFRLKFFRGNVTLNGFRTELAYSYTK